MASRDLAAIDQELAQKKAELSAIQQVGGPAPQQTWWSTQNAMTMSASVLVFGIVICGLAAWLIKRGKSSESILRTFGTILIIVSALFLVVAGYSDQQIAPVMGLLGTIAGYLLGKSTSAHPAGSTPAPSPSPGMPTDNQGSGGIGTSSPPPANTAP
ncbi:MAG TPA: hypothetical protein VNN09_05065 [Candidatus Competibacteraceae bacterium]|nr:hypothetical protein [Candidatus Competibacteraceae bacterium]